MTSNIDLNLDQENFEFLEVPENSASPLMKDIEIQKRSCEVNWFNTEEASVSASMDQTSRANMCNTINNHIKDSNHNKTLNSLNINSCSDSVISSAISSTFGKTKIISSIEKDYTEEYLNHLIKEGVRAFSIDGCLFTYKEYSELVFTIKRIFEKIKEIPTIIFDLNLPLQTLSRIDGNNLISKISSLGINIISCLVENVKDLVVIKDEMRINELNPNNINILARIETLEGIRNFDSIISKCVGVVISKGLIITGDKIFARSSDSFNENLNLTTITDMFLLENYIIEKSKKSKKILLMQTSLNHNLLVELSTIEYSVKKDFDGLILKEEETAQSGHSLTQGYNSLRSVREAIIQYESGVSSLTKDQKCQKGQKSQKENTSYISYLFESVVKASYDLEIKWIILYTDEFKKAKELANRHPHSIIIYPTDRADEVQLASLVKGIMPVYNYKNRKKLFKFNNQEKITKFIIENLKEKKLTQSEDKVLIVNAFEGAKMKFRNGMYIT